ncbi:MAG TPA: hypothetical protein ENK31_05590 [Nannocystis exedens]|nr:hypothetical protein [Nannocystis exedens]
MRAYEQNILMTVWYIQRIARAASIVLLSLTLGSCSGSEGESGESGESSTDSDGETADNLAEAWAEARCAGGLTCECIDFDEDQCRIGMAAYFNNLSSYVEPAGLTLSHDCYDRSIAIFPSEECLALESFVPSCEDPSNMPCHLFVGSRALGETCESIYALMDTCAEGLICGKDGRCRGICDEPPLPASVGAGDPCGVDIGLCPEGYYCNETCLLLGSAGDPCEFGYQCQSGTYCAETEQCTAKQSVGDACNSSAACLDSRCASGVCVEDAFQCLILAGFSDSH